MAVCCFFSLFMCVLQHPDAKMMQINLTGFLNGKNAREFMKDLWPLLLSAQENIAGIPSAFLEQKKEEIRQRQVGKMLIGRITFWSCRWLWRKNVPFVEMYLQNWLIYLDILSDWTGEACYAEKGWWKQEGKRHEREGPVQKPQKVKRKCFIMEHF